MSDDETFEEKEFTDFSASEEEWKPSDGASSSDFLTESEDSDQDASREQNGRNFGNKKGNRSTKIRKPRNIVKVQNIIAKPRPGCSFENVTRNKKKSSSKGTTSNQNDTDDSESSGDDYLVDPSTLDTKSSFFDVIRKTEMPPKFDCNAGMRLSDSECEDQDFAEKETSANQEQKPDIKNDVDEFSLNKLKQVHDFTKNLEEAKQHLRNLKPKLLKEEKNLNVGDLLALGESSSVGNKSNRKKESLKKRKHDSDSDWEEVNDTELAPAPTNQSLQITVQFQQKEKRSKTAEDLEAKLKRQLNRVIKENQIYLHKASVLCNIAHGNYCNEMINKVEVTKEARTLLPGPNSYPNGQTYSKYFEEMCKWFKSIISVKEDRMYSSFKTRPRLDISVRLLIKTKSALCKTDMVFMFISLLRGMGIQCRLVFNLKVLPLKPAQSDLCSLKQKKVESKENVKKQNEIVDVDMKKERKACSLNEKLAKNEKSTTKRKQTEKSEKSAPSCNDKTTVSTIEKRTSLRSGGKVSEQPDKLVTKKSSINLQKLKKKDLNLAANNDAATSTNMQNKDVVDTTKGISQKSVGVESTHFAKKSSNSVQSNVESATTGGVSMTKKKAVKQTKTQKLSKEVEQQADKGDLKTKNNAIKDDELITGRVTRNKLKKLKVASAPQLDGADDLAVKPKRVKSSKTSASLKKPKSTAQSEDSDDDFEPSPPKKTKLPTKDKNPVNKVKRIDKRVLSTDAEEEDPKKTTKNKMDMWVEVYAEKEKRWICIDLFKGKVDCVEEIRKNASSPLVYVFAWNNNGSIKDISARYCPQMHTATRKLRVEQSWLDETLEPYIAKKTSRDKAEDRELEKMHMEKPLPQTISEYKNHPLYALERHLLKFEGIYPRNALTLGFVRGEPVYARECVHTLHSREIWLKSARVVKPGETPYKIVKARPKWDKFTNTVIKDQPLEIFGYWQTKDYDPPTAENGIVPRNEYGNVELFKKCMLPKKTVHLQLPGINRVCKRLKIDCAPAVVGFDFHQGLCHPLLDGYVICEEYAEKVVDEWNKDQEKAERREEEKYMQRVYGNWKKLIRGLLIRERLKMKYNFGNEKKD